MSDNLQTQFIRKLEEQYGQMDKMTSRFGTATFGKVADDLCISASQFTKLIYGSATDGMYIRTIRNIDRLTYATDLEHQLKESAKKEIAAQEKMLAIDKTEKQFYSKPLFLCLSTLFLGAFVTWAYISTNADAQSKNDLHPLSAYFDLKFDAAYNSPYLKPDEVQDYCPCSAYEGSWSLNNHYKLPIPASRKPGIYYLAKSADVRMKCSKIESDPSQKGTVLSGFEHLINEIWVDLTQTPLSPTYFDKTNKIFTPAFENLNFEDLPQFKKVATINSFFIDRFEIHDEFISRSGEPCGRFASDIDQALVDEFEIDLKEILENVIGDLTITVCENAINKYCDPNELQEQRSEINFECLYTIESENLGLGGGYPYTKGYRLEKQNYSDNLTCKCVSTNI